MQQQTSQAKSDRSRNTTTGSIAHLGGSIFVKPLSFESMKSTTKRMAPPRMIHTLFVIMGVVVLSSAFIVLHCVTTTTVTNAFLMTTSTTTSGKSTPALSSYSTPVIMRRNRRRPNEIRTLSSTLDTGNTIDMGNISNEKNSDDDNNSSNDDDDTVVVTWLDNINDNEEDAKEDASKQTPTPPKTKTKTTWGSKLSPKVKERIILAGQQRAINNKQKRISDMDRKRRTLFSIANVNDNRE
jgi:hypothetical protein